MARVFKKSVEDVVGWVVDSKGNGSVVETPLENLNLFKDSNTIKDYLLRPENKDKGAKFYIGMPDFQRNDNISILELIVKYNGDCQLCSLFNRASCTCECVDSNHVIDTRFLLHKKRVTRK